jgi:hypothetical protein
MEHVFFEITIIYIKTSSQRQEKVGGKEKEENLTD